MLQIVLIQLTTVQTKQLLIERRWVVFIEQYISSLKNIDSSIEDDNLINFENIESISLIIIGKKFSNDIQYTLEWCRLKAMLIVLIKFLNCSYDCRL